VLVIDPPVAAALWSRLRAAVPDADRRSRAVDGELARAFLASGDLRRAEVTCRRAMRGAPPGLAGSLRLTLAATLMRQGRWAAVRAIGESAADSRLVHPAERAEQIGIAATAALAGGDPDWAREGVERAERAAWAIGVARVRGHTLAVRGHLAHLAGRLDEATSLLRDATALRGADGPVGDGTASVWLSLALADMDRFDDAAGVLDRALQTFRGGVSGRLEILRARAWLRLDAGLIRDAVDILDSLPPPEQDDGPAARVVIARRALAGLFLDGVRGAEPWLQRLRGDPVASQACYGSAWVARAIAARCAVDRDADGERQALAAGWAGCVDHGLSADLVVLAPHLAAAAAAA
jgi:hypothetical protein